AGILLRPIGTAVFVQRTILRVPLQVFRDGQWVSQQPYCFKVVKEQATGGSFGDTYADRHLVENLPQTVAFGFDLSRQTLTLGLCLLTPADIMDDDQRQRLPFAFEAHGADLDWNVSPVLASELSLDLRRRPTVRHQYSHKIPALIQVFRRNEFDEVPSSNVLYRSAENPQHCRVGQMNRPI